MEQRKEKADADAGPQACSTERLGAQVMAFAQRGLALVVGKLPGAARPSHPLFDDRIHCLRRIVVPGQRQ